MVAGVEPQVVLLLKQLAAAVAVVLAVLAVQLPILWQLGGYPGEVLITAQAKVQMLLVALVAPLKVLL